MRSIDEISASVWNAASLRTKHIRRASLFVKVGLLGIGSAVTSIAQFAQIPDGSSLSSWQIGGIIASLVVALAAIFIVLTEDDATDELNIARQAIEETRRITGESLDIDEIDAELSRHIAVYQSMNLMRGAVEVAVSQRLNADDTAILILKSAQRSLRVAMDFRTEDQATICIYKTEIRQDHKLQLRCVAHWREIECDVSNARTWEEGVGIAGICLSNATEIIVPDLQADGVKAIFGGAASQSRDYDTERYRSMAAVPVLSRGVTLPWGVVVSTTNRDHHFSADNQSGLKFDEGVRALASMIALGVITRTGEVT